MEQIPFFKHDLGKPELDAVADVLRGSILTTGETVANFEQRFADYLGRRYAVGTSSCTGALHIALLSLGIKPGNEVITTPMTFIATATAILQAGATPVFVDVEPETGNLDATKIEAAITKRTRAIIPVHLYGLMCNMKSIRKIADRYQLKIIEDSAHCIEGKRDGIRPGQLGDTACFSFYATKNITCGEGGAVVTDNEELAERLRLLQLHGMTKTAADRHKEGYSHWDMILMGWKYNMDNIQAALLFPQMDRLEKNWKKREKLALRYQEKLSNIPNITGPQSCPSTRHARHLFTVWMDEKKRDKIIEGLHAVGIATMVNYKAIHLLTYFRKTFGFKVGDFPVAERIGNQTISLPFYPNMPMEVVDHVTEYLSTLIRSF